MKKNSNFKIMAATLVALFNLTAVFSACIAWFTAKRKVDQNADGFEVVNYNGLLKGISLYHLDSESETENIYKDRPFLTYTIDAKKGTLQKESGKKDSVGKYDQLDKPFNSILYIFEFDSQVASNQDSISIKAKTTTKEEESPLNEKTPLKKEENSLTAITKFKHTGDWSSEKVFDFSKEKNLTSQEFFELETEGNQTKVENYTQSLSIISKSASGQTSSSFYFEVIIEYDTEALEYLYNLNLGSSVLDDIDQSNAITFKQDWYFEIK